MDILLATWNMEKVKWLTSGFSSLGLKIRCLDPSEVSDIEETGLTCEENALLKVRAVGELVDSIVIGEDSGLFVDALDGFPGVKTARWWPGTDDDRAIKLLDKLQEVPDKQRGAQFLSVIAILFPDGSIRCVLGNLEGSIRLDITGDEGAGYNRIFNASDLASFAHADQKAPGDHRDMAAKLAISEIQRWTPHLKQ